MNKATRLFLYLMDPHENGQHCASRALPYLIVRVHFGTLILFGNQCSLWVALATELAHIFSLKIQYPLFVESILSKNHRAAVMQHYNKNIQIYLQTVFHLFGAQLLHFKLFISLTRHGHTACYVVSFGHCKQNARNCKYY